jgi:hypothetical protein
LKEQIKKVEEFQKMFEIGNNYSPCLIDKDEFLLRHKLGMEELDEYLDACIKGDIISISDALGDQLYILCGTILRHGLQELIEPIFEEIHFSNLTKLENGIPKRRADGKIIKGANYKAPNLKPIIYGE